MSVYVFVFRPSIRIEQLDSDRSDFRENLNSSSFRKSVEKIQILSKSDKSSGYFTLIPIHNYDNTSFISS